jgi:predicted transcriptional regulator of viral defense system
VRKLTLAEIDQEIEITERDLADLRQQRAKLARIERPSIAVMEYMRRMSGECAKGQLQAALGIHLTVLSEALTRLTENGEIERIRWGVYRIKVKHPTTLS